MDIHKLRPKEDWVLVLDEKRRSTTAGGILVPVVTGAEKVTEGSGVLVAIGNGKKNRTLGLEKGMRIIYRSFLKFAHRMETDEKWEDGEAKHYFLMSADDVFGIIAPGVEVGVLSGRPQNQVKGD